MSKNIIKLNRVNKEAAIARLVLSKNDLERRLFYVFISIFIFSFLLYIIFLSRTVFHIVERKNIENDARTLKAMIANLEVEYLAESNKVDSSLASNLGFLEPKNVYFVSRQAVAAKISSNGREL